MENWLKHSIYQLHTFTFYIYIETSTSPFTTIMYMYDDLSAPAVLLDEVYGILEK